MDGGAWWAAVHGVAKCPTRLSDFTLTFHCHALEKEMATHSSVLAWRIPGTGEPGGLPFMGLYRVGHDWSDLAVAAATASICIYIYPYIFLRGANKYFFDITMVIYTLLKVTEIVTFWLHDLHICNHCLNKWKKYFKLTQVRIWPEMRSHS